MQGRNQVYSQRWTRLENFPHNKFPFWYTPNKFQWFQKVTRSSAHFYTFPLPFVVFLLPLQFPFFSSPFSLLSLPLFSLPLFSLSSCFPSPFPSSSFPHSLQNFPPNFSRVGDSPTSPTPNYATGFMQTGLVS